MAFLRSAKKASLRPLRGVSDGQGCRPGPANTGVPPATYGCSTAGVAPPDPREGFALPPWPERPTAAPLPTANQNEKAQRLDAIEVARLTT